MEAKIILGYENFADWVFCSRGPFNLRNVQLISQISNMPQTVVINSQTVAIKSYIALSLSLQIKPITHRDY